MHKKKYIEFSLHRTYYKIYYVNYVRESIFKLNIFFYLLKICNKTIYSEYFHIELAVFKKYCNFMLKKMFFLNCVYLDILYNQTTGVIQISRWYCNTVYVRTSPNPKKEWYRTEKDKDREQHGHQSLSADAQRFFYHTSLSVFVSPLYSRNFTNTHEYLVSQICLHTVLVVFIYIYI